MLENVTVDTFKPLENAVFIMAIDPQTKIALTLNSVSGKPQQSYHKRVPFSLLFQSAEAVVRPQRIYEITHDSVGSLSIFLVPVGRAGEGVLYEAIFA